jgi:rare lipoprotein A (peptidoglycan hydrolase)
VQPFRANLVTRCSGKQLHSSASFRWSLRAFAIGFAIFFAMGCAHTGSKYDPLAFRRYRSAELNRSHSGTARWEKLGKTRIVTASWYGPGYEGKRTASGEPFNSKGLTAASKRLPLNSTVRVTNLRNGRSVKVRVNDRGPTSSKRALDLSPAAARTIGLTKPGVARVKIAPVSSTTD